MLMQLYLDVVSTWPQPVGLVISTDLQKIAKFYSAKYFSQYTNNSTTDKLVNSYSNFLTVIHIRYNGENGDAQKSSNFEISKLQNLEKS